ncbi:hypothetical protein HanXRQr2_Chr01g0003761 [Helianthus annuus]|uniref:Uncharacterized protein n=1 Tax=Helianthus annuus TaxID=4232 RepID=A0A251VMN2_HELAN|nr:hypothetical protein HanXRQr2_Chr01g0003761 [Helianthus annuus]
MFKILQLSEERRIEPSNQVLLKISATPVRLFHNFIIVFFLYLVNVLSLIEDIWFLIKPKLVVLNTVCILIV